MRKLIFLAIILFVLPGSIIAQKYDSWSTVKEKGRGKLSIAYFESPGFITVKNGEPPKGICIDIINEFIEFVKVKYSKIIEIELHEEKDFPAFLDRVKSSPNLLGVSEITVTNERMRDMKFTNPFFVMPIILVTNKSTAPLKSLADLKEFYPYTLKSGAYSEMIAQLQKRYSPNSKISYLNNTRDIMTTISSTPNSYTLISQGIFLDAVRKSLNVKAENVESKNSEILAMAMAKNSDWDTPWNEFLTDDYLKSSDYKKSVAKNLGSVFLKTLSK